MEIQVEQQIKDAAVEVFQKAGLTEEEAVALFYKRTAATGKLTFPVEEERKDENKKVKKEKSELVLFIRDMLISFAISF